MRLALKLVFWEAMTAIDEAIHLVFYRVDFPVPISDMLYEFCQWSWLGWDQTLDMIQKTYEPKQEDLNKNDLT